MEEIHTSDNLHRAIHSPVCLNMGRKPTQTRRTCKLHKSKGEELSQALIFADLSTMFMEIQKILTTLAREILGFQNCVFQRSAASPRGWWLERVFEPQTCYSSSVARAAGAEGCNTTLSAGFMDSRNENSKTETRGKDVRMMNIGEGGKRFIKLFVRDIQYLKGQFKRSPEA